MQRRQQEREARRVVVGRGPGEGPIVTTSDTLVEGVHFDLSYTNAREVGHKALAVGLSDVAAMGAVPFAAHMAVGVRQETSETFLLEMRAGVDQLARRQKIKVQFTTGVLSPTALFVSCTVFARAKGSLVGYDGARPGDLLAVVGTLGASAAGLNCLRTLGRQPLTLHQEIVKAHLAPEPRVKEALALRATGGVHAIAELADGLASELHLLTDASGVGALVDETRLPISDATVRGSQLLNTSPRAWVLYGGEDFGLLAAIAPKAVAKAQAAMRRLKLPFHVIGECLPRRDGVKLREAAGDVVAFQPRLWHHFVRRRKRAA